MTRNEAIAFVMAARTDAELFGTADPARQYRRLARLLHPDHASGPDSSTAATDAFVRLTTRWQARGGITIHAPGGREYRIGDAAYTGDLANLYRCGDERLLKLPRSPASNDLMAREARTLRRLADRGDPRYLPYVPRLVDSFRHRDGATGARRQVNVIAAGGGLHSLAEVRRRYPSGVDGRDAAWMWRRLLVALGLAHRAGVVHGAVVPDHVLIQPDEHGVVLVDWCYAALDGTELIGALIPSYVDWYPREVRRREIPGPGTDIAMAARCMAFVMGDRAPAALRRFADGCTLPDPRHRPTDAWRLLSEFDELLERLYGPRKFHQFSL